MPNNYWYDRENEQRKKNITDSAKYDKTIQEIYNSSMDNIQKEIDSFYSKYASQEGITIAEAKRKASKLDIEAYERKAKKYVKDKNFSKQANEEMKLYNMTMKVNRLELLKANIGLELTAASDEFEKSGTLELTDKATSEYERQAGILGDTVLDNSSNANSIVNASFKNATFSDRVWNNQDALRNSINTLITQGLISGQNPKKLAQKLRKYVASSTYDAQRLMRTEMARVQTSVQEDSYKSMGFEEYEFISLGNACSDCLYLNGRHFKLKDMEPGTNAPPIHPNCRCSTAPYMDDKDYNEWLDLLDNGGTTEGFNLMKKLGINIENNVKHGNIKLEINKDKQNRHLESSHVNGRSYLYGSLNNAQKIVEEYSGSGTAIIISDNDEWTSKERITCSKTIGVHIDAITGKANKTNKAIIIYSKTGTHVVPRREK